jgi:hypothetical protein
VEGVAGAAAATGVGDREPVVALNVVVHRIDPSQREREARRAAQGKEGYPPGINNIGSQPSECRIPTLKSLN